ncbi:MAG: protein-disulfide reductase DsbD [Gammaproteobacteria bacterium]|nr:protein-disulfide reductase DsbD [Gammaproteobacteria bacterium]
MKKKLFALPLFLLLSSLHAAAPEDELLEPDKAFQLSTRSVDGATLEASWKIAPGYYMYRDKFKFEPLDGSQLQAPVIPRGKIKTDPLFGEVEIFTNSVKVRVPFTRAEGAESARLRITSQGCNEPVGVCYPPIIKEVDFRLPPGKAKPAAAAPAPAGGTQDKIASLKDLTRGLMPAGEVEPVDPEKAFRISVMARDNTTLLARIEIDECCYLYRDKTGFELVESGGSPVVGVGLAGYTLPPGKTKIDEFIGKTVVLVNDFETLLPVTGLGGIDRDLRLKVMYQGCSEKGVAICYPPATKTFDVQYRGGVLSAVDTSLLPPSAPGGSAARNMNTLVLAVIAAFGAGLLLTFTPCVLPLVPILSSIIVGQGDIHISKLRGGMLSYLYVLGTAVTYTAAGILAGYSGDQLQSYFQNPWAIGAFAALLGLLALSLFGFYDLQMPSFIQSRLHQHAHHGKGGSYAGVFVLGLISALIVGACVSPVLISVLGAAIASRDPVLGGSIMFSLAHGQGAILVALGVGAGYLLPRVGKWMDSVKHLFGALLIAVAIYLLGYLPDVPVLFLWAAFFIVSGVYLGATQSLPEGASGWRSLWKGAGTFLLIWGVLALLGGFAGNRDVFRPLPLSVLSSGLMPVTASPETEHLFVRVSSLNDLENRLAAAKSAGKPVILDYYADWCTDCLRMEKITFADPRVRAELRSRFVLLQADVTDPNHPEGKAIKQRFGVYGPPAMLFFAADGQERRELRTYGFRNVEELFVLLRQI